MREKFSSREKTVSQKRANNRDYRDAVRTATRLYLFMKFMGHQKLLNCCTRLPRGGRIVDALRHLRVSDVVAKWRRPLAVKSSVNSDVARLLWTLLRLTARARETLLRSKSGKVHRDFDSMTNPANNSCFLSLPFFPPAENKKRSRFSMRNPRAMARDGERRVVRKRGMGYPRRWSSPDDARSYRSRRDFIFDRVLIRPAGLPVVRR